MSMNRVAMVQWSCSDEKLGTRAIGSHVAVSCQLTEWSLHEMACVQKYVIDGLFCFVG